MPPDTAGRLQTPGLSACLSQEDPREFQTPVHCLSDSFLGPQHSTCTRGFNYRLENLGGEGRQRGRPVRISLETSVHVRTAHGVQFLPSLNEQAVKTTNRRGKRVSKLNKGWLRKKNQL